MTIEDTAPMQPPGGGDGWTRGASVGRFVVLGTLGSGGMGRVYSAYDPLLDRKVALKTLRAQPKDGAPGTLLVREAQAMARLQHPNVCAVHDIGNAAGQLFVAMELVDGETLRPWMKQPRPWREALRMLVAAGRGVEAAHAAGLVHRDFKPENVLVGADGRPRVTDFGLVSLLSESSSASTPAGTPAYMSPEQLRGEPADARSDQFSFCVVVWEALAGERPFPSNAPPDQRRPEAAGRELPAWLTAALVRGMALRPDDRWPSMSALLEALGRDPALARRLWLGRAAALAALLAIPLGVKLARDRERHACDGASERMAGIWDAPTQQRLEQAFTAAAAADTWGRVRGLVDGYVQRWTAVHQEACRATRVEGRQSDTLLDLRMACLERRRATLAALTGLWLSSLDAQHAGTAAASLEPLGECSDPPALLQPLPLPRDDQTLRRIISVRAGLDRVRALLATAHWGDAVQAAQRLRADADATAYPPVQAEAALLLGAALNHLGDPAAAPTLEEAARLAALAHDDNRAARALTLLVLVLSNDAARFERALGTIPAAAAFVARAGDPPALRGALLEVHAQALLDAGKAREAREKAGQAVPLLESSLGPNAPDTLAAAAVLAGAADAVGDYDTARATCRRLVTTESQLDGPESPGVAKMLLDLGMVEEHSGHHDAARDAYEKALAIDRKALGPNNAVIADVLNDLANLDYYAGRFDDAAARYEQVVAIFGQRLDPSHAYLAIAWGNLGAARRGQGRLAEAQALGEKSVALARQSFGPKHPQVGEMESEYAATLRARGDFRQARAVAEDALAIFTAAGSAPERVGKIGFELAQDLWGGDRRAERSEARQLPRGRAEGLARFDQARALQAAAGARAHLLKAGDAGKKELARLDEWLAQRKR